MESETKWNYDKKVNGVEIKVGDRVLLRNHKERGGTGKLRSHWEKTVYIVTEVNPNIPVYTVKSEIGTNPPTKKVHRNNLMSCSFLLPEKLLSDGEIYSKKRKQKNGDIQIRKYDTDESSDDEEIIIIRTNNDEEDNAEISNDDVVLDEEALQEERNMLSEESRLESPDAVEVPEEIENKVPEDSEELNQEVAEDSEELNQEVAEDRENEQVIREDDDEEGQLVRRSTRRRERTKVFTYKEVGGEPTIERI